MKSLFILLAASLLCCGALAADSALTPTLVAIPAGKINTSACPVGVAVCPYDDYVERVIEVKAFEMGATEVTFDEYDACVKDGGCASPVSEWAYENREVKPPCLAGKPCNYPFDESWGRGKRPVVNVNWADAQLYIKWLNAKTGSRYRLPTSVEWEYAALGGVTTTYPWGAKLGKKNANCDGCGSQWDNRQSAPVGSFKPNKFGLYEMVGNVSEWSASCFPTRTKGSQECMKYIYRSSAWSYVAKSADPRLFNDVLPHIRESHLGFRLAR